MCDKHAIPYEYYHIGPDFFPVFEKKLGNNEFLYLVNFYGQISNQQIAEWKKKFQRIIVDNAQSFFQMPVDEVDTLYTCRKYFGVADGAYLYTKSKLKRELEVDVSFERMRYLLGRYEIGASEFYSEYSNNNQHFQNEPLKSMSKLTHNLLRSINYSEVIKTLNSNFRFLHAKFRTIYLAPISVPNGAFAYPLHLNEGDRIRKQLQKQRVYIPTLWPSVLSLCDRRTLEYEYALNVLPLPVDHRYTAVEMEKVAS